MPIFGMVSPQNGGKLMKITRIEKTNDHGQLEVSFALTEQQTQVLLEFAINMLVHRGLVEFDGDIPSQQEETTLEQAMSEVMVQAKPSDLPQA